MKHIRTQLQHIRKQPNTPEHKQIARSQPSLTAKQTNQNPNKDNRTHLTPWKTTKHTRTQKSFRIHKQKYQNTNTQNTNEHTRTKQSEHKPNLSEHQQT